MAHELTQRANGKVEMAYVGATPWHGLGQQLDQNASIETWIKQAGMDWAIRKAPVHYYADRAQTQLRAHDDQVVLVRSDTGAPLGIVSESYNIVQPAEVLEFFRSLVSDSGFALETAGTMFGGRRYWALAKITDGVIAGWDKVGGYLLLTTSADGSFASEARETTVRVVCNNTLSMAVARAPGQHHVRITHREVFDAAKIKAQLSLTGENFEKFMTAAVDLSKIRVSFAAADDLVSRLLRPAGVQVEDDEEQDSRRPRGLDTILALFDGAGLGAQQKGSAGTAWGLVNAVTEYVDHHATAKSTDHRLARAWYGNGDKLKVAAFDQIAAAYL